MMTALKDLEAAGHSPKLQLLERCVARCAMLRCAVLRCAVPRCAVRRDEADGSFGDDVIAVHITPPHCTCCRMPAMLSKFSPIKLLVGRYPRVD